MITKNPMQLKAFIKKKAIEIADDVCDTVQYIMDSIMR